MRRCSCRANRFAVYGPEGSHLSLRDVLAGQMEHDYFPVELDQLAARIAYRDLSEGAHEIDGLANRGATDESSVGDLGLPDRGRTASPSVISAITSLILTGIWREWRRPGQIDSIRHAGDRRHAEFMRGAGLVIHEAQYTPEEYPAKRNWGHSTYAYVVHLAAAAGVRRLFLTHHDPSHDDDFLRDVERRARQLARELRSPMEVTCAYEGLEVAA